MHLWPGMLRPGSNTWAWNLTQAPAVATPPNNRGSCCNPRCQLASGTILSWLQDGYPPSAQYPRAAIGWPVREVTILQCWHQEHALSCAVTRCASAGTHCKPPAGQDATVWITLWLNKPSHGVDLLAPRAAAVCCQALAGPPGLNAFHTQQSVTPVAAPGAPHASPAGQVPSSCVD